jgi:Spy/CpxP family protein refolding chaperone
MTKVMVGLVTFSSCGEELRIPMMMTSNEIHNEVTMKIKLMPMLAGVIALGVVATPLVVKAQANTSDQPVPAQSKHHHQSIWDKLGLSDQQKAQIHQIHQDTHTQMQSILTQEQQDQLKAATQNGQGKNHQAWRQVMASLTSDQKAKMQELRQQEKSRTEGILTPDQKQQWQQMQQQWQQMRQQRQQQQNKQ